VKAIRSTALAAFLLFLLTIIFLIILIAAQCIRGSAVLYEDEISMPLSAAFSLTVTFITLSYAFVSTISNSTLLVAMWKGIKHSSTVTGTGTHRYCNGHTHAQLDSNQHGNGKHADADVMTDADADRVDNESPLSSDESVKKRIDVDVVSDISNGKDHIAIASKDKDHIDDDGNVIDADPDRYERMVDGIWSLIWRLIREKPLRGLLLHTRWIAIVLILMMAFAVPIHLLGTVGMLISTVRKPVTIKLRNAPVFAFARNLSGVVDVKQKWFDTFVSYTKNKTLPDGIVFRYNSSDPQYQALNDLRYNPRWYTAAIPHFTNLTQLTELDGNTSSTSLYPFNTTFSDNTNSSNYSHYQTPDMSMRSDLLIR
jgi:hypothetical protein